MEKTHERLIRFDWAIKRLLRHKADHTILNGFLSSLLGREIRIVRILESEGNKETADDKYSPVVILAENENKEKILIEVRNDNETALFHFYGKPYETSKIVTEYIKDNENHGSITEAYSIKILYFRFALGEEYVYQGSTQYVGVHNHKPLHLTFKLIERYNIPTDPAPFSQYYLLMAADFDRWSDLPLDQWLYFLSNTTIPESATAPGLQEARAQLRVDSLDEEAREAYYYSHLDSIRTAKSLLQTAYDSGFYEGKEIGIEEGRKIGIEEGRKIRKAEGREKGSVIGVRQIALNMLNEGYEADIIQKVTDLSQAEIESLL